MTAIRLHCFALSGNAYKAALMLELSGLKWEPVFVDFLAGATRDPDWRTHLNEMGEVPILEHGGERLTQSGVILDYLADLTGKFAPRNAAERREVLRWILFDNHKFTSYFATLRFLVDIQKAGESPVTEFLRARARAAYQIVDRHLADRAFMVGDHPTIADLSLAGYVYFPEHGGLDRMAFAHIEAWKARIMALPGWKHPYDLMPGKPEGRDE